ncbi:MAG: MFS transporter [Candidatus Lokiarchaeota archaeon]|nr:MFS transporter [Candidatus Lokiarchaeota archaeon]
MNDNKSASKGKKKKRKGLFDIGSRSTKYIWTLCIFASLVNFFDGWATAVISFTLPLEGGDISGTIYEWFGFSPESFQVAIIFIVAGLGVMASIIFKYLSDKYGRKPLYLITSIGFTTFTVMTAFVPEGPQFFPLFLAVRFFASLFLAADLVVVIITEEAPDKSRARLIGITVSMNFMGLAMVAMTNTMPNLLPALFPHKWQSLFFLPVVGIIFIIPIYFKMKETNRFVRMNKYLNWRRSQGAEIKKTSWFTPLRKKYSRALLLCVIPGIGITILMMIVLQWLPLFLADELLIENWEFLVIPFALCGVASFFVNVYLMGKWNRRQLALRGTFIMFLGGLLVATPAPFCHPPLGLTFDQYMIIDPANCQLILAMRHYLIPIIMAGFCIGAFGGPLTLSGITLMPLEMVPTHILSTAQGWWNSLTRVATILSPMLTFWGAVTVGQTGPETGGLTFAWSYFGIGIFLITTAFSIIYLSPSEGTAKGKSLEEIISATSGDKKLKREKSRRYEYLMVALSFIVYFVLTFIYGMLLGSNYFGFDPFIPQLQVLGVYGAIAIGLMAIVIYAREKWIGVEEFQSKKLNDKESRDKK